MDSDKKQTRLEKNREYMRRKRENETPEQREKRLEKARNYMRQKRDNELHQKWLVQQNKKMSGVASAASSVFNAFAFAGASWIMSKIDHGDYVKEVHRHDLALEKLQRDRDQWNQSRLREIDRLQQLHYDEHESTRDIEETNKVFENLPKFNVDVGPRPKISDNYTPSKKMQEYIGFTKFLVAVPAAYMFLLLI